MTFKLKSSLNAHKKRHFAEKRFECDVCGKKVFSKSSLKQHKFSHTEERPFNCEICNRKFKTAPLLARHAYVHTGGGKYCCYICKTAFVRKEYWRVHMKKLHNENMDHEKRKRFVSPGRGDVKPESAEEESQEYDTEYDQAQEIHIQEGAFSVIAGESGGAQIAIGEEIVGVIGGEEELAAVGPDGNVQSLDKDTQAQVEYLVNLQYEYVK